MNVTLFLNHQCNLRCIYCYGGEKFSQKMPVTTMQKALDLLYQDEEKARLVFFGGEPLLEFSLIQRAVEEALALAKKLKKPPPSFSITTNGTLLTAEKIDFFQRHAFHLAISLDGIREAHEHTRPFANGHSSFDLVVANSRQALQKIPSADVIAVIDPLNVSYLADSFDFFLELGFRNINFNFNYSASWEGEDWNNFERALEKLGERYLHHYARQLNFWLNLFDSKIISYLKSGYSCHDRCKFGLGEVTVAPSGRLYPCDRLVEEDPPDAPLSIGDLESGIDFAKVLLMNQRKNTPDLDCEGCAIIDRCAYWCGCTNQVTTGDYGQTSELTCRVEQLLVNTSDKLAEHLFQEKNPLFIQKFY